MVPLISALVSLLVLNAIRRAHWLTEESPELGIAVPPELGIAVPHELGLAAPPELGIAVSPELGIAVPSE